MKKSIALLIATLLFHSSLIAGEADVVAVSVNRESGNTYVFSVTVQHQDTGWEHYADRWEVVGPNGSLLGRRILYHPHVNEQPFTRNLTGVEIPGEVRQVTIRAHDSVHRFGGKTMTVHLPEH